MTAVNVAFDGTKLSGANSESDGGTWDKLGVTQSPTEETDVFYEDDGVDTTLAISNKISGGTGGMDFNDGATVDLETTPQVVIALIAVTTYGLINLATTQGIKYYIGTGAQGTNYYEYDLYGSAQGYPARGGFVIVIIDPNVAGYRARTTGSAPDLSAVDYYGLYADITATVKTDNVVHDTLSHFPSGKGLTLTLGDGASADGVFQDFIDEDEGTVGNRWGVVISVEGILISHGTLTIGASGSATEFTDSIGTVVFPDGRVNAGALGLALNIENASTAIAINNYTFISNGNLTTADTRGLLSIIGTSGTCVLTGCTFVNFATPTLTTKPDFISCIFANSDVVDIDTTTFTDCTFQDAPDAAVLMQSVSHNLTGGTIKDNVVGIEIDTAGTFPLANVGFSGNTNDIRNSVEASQLTIASVGGTNHKIGDGTIIAAGQSFLGTATVLSRAIFRLREIGTATGNAVCKLYASTGSDPTRTPTGAALATSNTVDVSTIGASYVDVPFEFEDEYTMSAVNYFAVIEYVGDVSNHIEVDANATGATYANNNFASNTGSWAAIDDDADFSINTGGIVKVAVSGTTPSSLSVINSATVKGATIISASVTLTITVQDKADNTPIQNVQTSIKLLNSPFTQLMNEDTNASGIATEAYGGGTPVDVVVITRKSEDTDNPRYFSESSIQEITSSGLTLIVGMRQNPFI